MNDIYDIVPNLNTNLIDYKLSIYYFVGFIFLLIFLYFLPKKKSNQNIKKSIINLEKIYENKLDLFNKNYLNYDINKFYNELNKILFLCLKLNVDSKIKDLNNKELEVLEIEFLLKNRIKSFYIHQFESNFDTKEYRKLTHKELLEIISNIQK